ncbi:MAG: 50S ribosomal protein L21 [Phototrophicales bacterium]|nr:MAG: 50S ribosomal protein L21 [Phototrophicales bacterium]
MYAIVRTGGRQYRAEVGQTIDVEKLPYNEGDTIELDEVLLVANNGDVKIGQPLVEGAKVKATVVSQFKGPKIIIFKYKPKKRYRKRQGHRQHYTRLKIESIDG